MMEFKRLWSVASDIDYDPGKTVELLENFNNAINGLYALSGETRFIADTLNSATYEIAEYDRLIAAIGDLATIADTLEMARNLMFGGCVDWDYVLSGFKELAKEEHANKMLMEVEI
jgi:hypothetical protein